MGALQHLHRSYFPPPVIGPPLKTQWAVSPTILMAGDPVLHFPWPNDGGGVGIQGWKGNPHLVVVAVGPNDGIEAELTIQVPFRANEPPGRARQFFYPRPLELESFGISQKPRHHKGGCVSGEPRRLFGNER